MNLDSLSFALYNISYSVANLTKKNFKSSVQEISRLVAFHGLEAERHLLRCLFSHVDFSGDGKSSGKDFHQTQYLIQECVSLFQKPHFISTICYAIDCPLQQQKSLKPSPNLVPQVCKVLKFSPFQEITFGIALLHSNSEDLRSYTFAFLKEKIPRFLKINLDPQSGSPVSLADLSLLSLEYLLLCLYSNGKELGVLSVFREAFHGCVREAHRTGLHTNYYTANLESYLNCADITLIMEGNLANLNTSLPDDAIVDRIRDVGYAFTASLDDCRNNSAQLGFREPTPSVVARILSMMARTHTGMTDSISVQSMNSNNVIMWNENKEKTEGNQPQSWNVEIFVQVLHEIMPNLDWKETVHELDHPNFLLSDRQGLKLLWQALIMGLGHEPFPMDLMYRRWRNLEGQFSFFQQVLSCPDVVCLTDYNHRPVTIDALKAPPEEDNRSISNWKSLDLIETLLSLSETPYFKDEVFKFPVQQCPDLLVLGLIQTTRSMNQFHKDILSKLIPIFLNNHPNSAIVLHLAWHSQVHTMAVKNIIMHAMADWYVRGDYDQTRLSRILDVAQDLKALSLLLNVTPFMFVIDLACLASRREYLKLDKWLVDKVREHGEGFVQACINFLRRRCPQIVGGNLKEDALPKTALPPETLAVICHVLQNLVGSVSQDLSETILSLVNSCSLAWNSRASSLPGSVKNSRGLESVLSSAAISAQNTSIDPLSGLSSSVTGLSLGQNIKTSLSGNSVFPVSRDMHPFTSASMGSPIKNQSTAVSSVSQLSQNFSNLPSNSSQLQSHFSSQLVGDISAIFPDLNHPVAKEIEDEANSYFQRIYNHPPHPTLTIDEVLDMLKRFQESPVQREKDVFNCMIRNLLEEYRFFPVYPDKELMTTAQLFGGIIEHNLVNYLTLGIALRYVLDALKKGQNSKMFYFGITAMDRFKNRLKEYPQYCQYLTTISTFHDLPHHLIEYLEYGARSQEPPRALNNTIPSSLAAAMTTGFPALSASNNAVAPATTTTASVTANVTKSTITGKPSIANATNIDTLLGATEKDEKIVIPPESVQDKVAFIINNLSQANLAQKTEEFKEVLKEEYWPWASQYLVMKRASIEPNFHSLYSNFLDTLKHSELTKLVIQETFRNIKVLLRSDKVIANFSDRSLLKNLGHWLGMLTLAKSKPILQIEIDIKSLLVEAYTIGLEELLYVVPFIAKVLESCAKSKVFKPPNPWTMAIMSSLSELHKEQNLKLNLKFEIEVLCKTLGIDINDLKPSNILKDPKRVENLERQLSPLPKPKEPASVPAISTLAMAPKPLPSVISEVQNPLPLTPVPLPTEENPNTIATAGNLPPSVMTVPQVSTAPITMAPPQFSYNDISITTIGGLAPHITINSQLALFQAHAQLKQCVRPAIERAVQEWIVPVVERSVKIALTTCENIIKKDFALDPEESRIRVSAHHMVRYLTAGMAMITCKDPLLISITNNLKQAFLSAGASQQQKELIEQAAQVVAQENVELACCFIQKTAIEKAVPEIDKRLTNEYELRKIARSEGRRYCDGNILTYQAERIPEQIRLKVGSVPPQQIVVYEEFNRCIPGFLPNTDPSQNPFGKVNLNLPLGMQNFGTDEVTQTYDKLASDLDHMARTGLQPNSSTNSSLHISALHSLVDAVHLARNSRDIVSALALVQKATEALLEVIGHVSVDHEVGMRFRDGHLLVLKVLADQRMYGLQWTSKQVTRCIMECREESRYNMEAIDVLLRSRLIDLPSFDLHLSSLIEKGNYLAVTFAMQFVKLYLIDDRQSGFVTENDLGNTIETLARLSTVPRQSPEGLAQLLEMLRTNNESGFLERTTSSGPSMMMHTGINQAREFDDPPGLYEKTEYLLREWVTMHHSPNAGRDSSKAFTLFLHQMNLQGILKTDELITRFFRISTEMCVDHCYQQLLNPAITSPTLVRTKCFHTIDAFVRLIALLVKLSGDASNTLTKLNFLNKVLGVMAGVLLQDQEVRGVEFQQLAYHRIFIMLFLELTAPDPILEAINSQVVHAFANTLYYVRPYKAPGFCYAWLELISHRAFLGRMLAVAPQPKVHTSSGCPPSWGLYAQLLISLFKFLTPFLRNVELSQPIHLLYKGTLKVLLILLHDFPEFLCDYHYHFCDVIPPNCIQMRNLILSAFPRNMRLPDPFTPNLKVDLLPEIKQQPRMVANLCSAIQPASFKQDLDSYIKTRSPVTFLSELRTNLQNTSEPGMRYNIPLINALVLYVGTQAIAYIQNKGNTPSMGTITHSSHMDIFQNLAVDLDTEGRYLFLNAIANQLRYPNSHTHYFSCTLLYLFAEANTEVIQEQITRVLMERLIVNRPHPWGLLITFIELIKNQTFKFWSHDFVRCAPEIEKLFESVARSCMHPKPTSEQQSS